QKMKTCLSLLLLLLGLCQAQPLDMDIITDILISNNDSNEILLEGDLSQAQPLVGEESVDDSFHQTTCIRFVPRQNQYDHISVQSGGGCYSSLGRTGGRQVLSLRRSGCMNYGIMQHELNHALGFNHEQTRSDRDQYVRINWRNINRRSAYNFKKKNTNNLNTPYDYTSIMHYGRRAFSINGRDSITPIPNSRVRIGQRKGMTKNDILRINRLYCVVKPPTVCLQTSN
uniref:Metalloendopeptidase n=1 Tax=Gadus morhua TaxID=8049 RepID=A0A8C4ZTL5_GADMO